MNERSTDEEVQMLKTMYLSLKSVSVAIDICEKVIKFRLKRKHSF